MSESRPPDSAREAARAAGLPKLIQGSRLKLRLAGGAIVVLVLGILLAPRAVPQPPAEENVAPMLAASVERQEPARFMRGVQQTGRAALDYSVCFRAPRPARPATHADFGSRAPEEQQQPDAIGILLAGGEVLTHVSALGGDTQATGQLADGTKIGARVRAYEAGTGLILLQLTEPTQRPGAPVASEPPLAGALVVAAARFEQGELVVPVFVGAVDPRGYTLTAAGGLLPPGTPVYSLSGDAVAVAAGHSSLAHSLAAALSRLRERADQGIGLPRTIGVCLQPVDAALAALVGDGGVLVSDLQESGPAERAGLRPGDLLLAVGGAPTAAIEAARRVIASLRPGQTAPVTVRRQGKEHVFDVPAEETLALDPCGERRSVPPDAPPARRAIAAADLRAAGLSEDAFVLTVDGTPVTERSLPSVLRKGRGPRLVQVQDGTRRLIAVMGSGT